MRSTLTRGDIVLFDRLYTSYVDMAYLLRNGIDFVRTLHIGRDLGLHRKRRVGKNDWHVDFDCSRPGHVGQEKYDEIQHSISDHCHQLSRSKRSQQRKNCRSLPAATEHRAGLQNHQIRDEYGSSSMPVARYDSQGDMGSYAGLQLGSSDDDGGRKYPSHTDS